GGPFVDAWVRADAEDRDGSAALLDGFRRHMGEACIGSISEIFDAQPPYTPRGCVAQAWSVAEVLRALVKTGGGQKAEARERVAQVAAPATVPAETRA